MNKQEYKEYCETVSRNLDNIEHISTGLCSSCHECQSAYDYEDQKTFDEDICSGVVFDEPSFSRSSCTACGSTLGGDRHVAHGIVNDTIFHFDICGNCWYYHEYGRLDDTTMEKIENSP